MNSRQYFETILTPVLIFNSRHYGDVVVVKVHGPAGTLKITTPNGRHISVDLTLAIRVQWPVVAKEWTTRPRGIRFLNLCHACVGYFKGSRFFQVERITTQ